MLRGSTRYRKYFENEFGTEPLYISKFVLMEYKRGLLYDLVEFCVSLKHDGIKTLSDAISLWSNKFESRKVKNVLVFTGQLFETRRLKQDNYQDKEKAFLELARVIKRMEQQFCRRFKDTGDDATRCSRALVKFTFRPESALADLEKFIEGIDDVDYHRSQCEIASFLLTRHKAEVVACVAKAKQLKSTLWKRFYRKEKRRAVVAGVRKLEMRSLLWRCRTRCVWSIRTMRTTRFVSRCRKITSNTRQRLHFITNSNKRNSKTASARAWGGEFASLPSKALMTDRVSRGRRFYQ